MNSASKRLGASKKLLRVLDELANIAKNIFQDRELKWRPHASVYFQRAAVTALLVRQYRLFLYFLRGPSFWDTLLAPTLLRMMIENVITIEWICADLDRRSAMYIDYGLGQARLYGENLRKFLEEDGHDEFIARMADAQFEWIERQKMLHFVDINLGNWSDTDLRAMAKEIGLDDLYRFGFVVFSAATHGTWYHTGMHDVRPCENKLHKSHLVGHAQSNYISEDFLFRACKYFDLVVECLDRQLDIKRRRSLRRFYQRKETEIVSALGHIFQP